MTRRPGEYADADQLAQEMLDAESEKAAPATAATPETAKDATPAKPDTWESRLEAAGLTPKQAETILDAMIEKGHYEKTFPLYGNRQPLTLRTRDSYCRQRVANALDALRTNDPRVHSQTMMRLNLAGSIVQFGKKTLPFAPSDAGVNKQDEAFNERLAFVDGLPDTFIDTLYQSLAQFDKWTYAALSTGAPSGF